MHKSSTLPLSTEDDLYATLQLMREYGSEYLYTKIDIEEMVLALSEIAANAIRHGGGGEVAICAKKNGGVLSATVSDSGKGIPNIEFAKREGYSTIKTSLGLGLLAAERLVDKFEINSEPGYGTTVVLEKHRPIKHHLVDYGIVSIPDALYNFNGDQYLIKEYDGDSVLIGLIDGPGQGYDAYAIASSCKDYITSNYNLPIDKLLLHLDLLMKESNDDVGITASFARISPGKVIYKGYGDTHAYLIKDGKFNYLSNQSGRLGQLSKYKNGISQFSFQDKIQLAICSDGLSTIPLINPSKGTAQEVANNLFDKYHKPKGDASILTIIYRNEKRD